MLRIIADDFGIYASVNKGIASLITDSCIDGTSLMSNGDAFNDAILLSDNFSNKDIGVHLVLVEEKPLTGIKFPFNHRYFLIFYLLGLIKLSAIRDELDAQISKCISGGIKPVFLNSHQHLHLLPRITDIVIDLAKKYNIKYIRIINEPLNFREGTIFRNLQLAILNYMSVVAKKKILKSGIETNSFFVGFLNAGNLSNRDIETAKMLNKRFPDKIIELGCHPGFEDDILRERYKLWGGYKWENEYNLLAHK